MSDEELQDWLDRAAREIRRLKLQIARVKAMRDQRLAAERDEEGDPDARP